MKKTVNFTAISLAGNPEDPAAEPVKLKLFYESGKDSEYAEIYANFYWAAGRFEFYEKDPEYRSTVLNALSNCR